MKISDQEAGYYLGVCSHAGVLHQMCEEMQEKGLDPYKIVEYILFSNAKLQDQALQHLKDSEFTFEEEHDTK